MCGIVGLFSPAGDSSKTYDKEHVVRSMANQLPHRGPDATGTWADRVCNIAFGHTRLSINDLSQAGSQPMHSESGRFVIALNGEIYNFRELRKTLTSRRHAFKGHSDTEVFLAAIEEWGLNKALGRVHGMFAFSLWDRRHRRLTLVRDRLGEKPLYYTVIGGLVAFASELKALKPIREWRPRIDQTALHAYFRYNYIPAPLSIYEDTWKLMPGHMVSVSLGQVSPVDIKQQQYWNVFDIESENEKSNHGVQPEDLVDELHGLLQKSVARQLISDVPTGVFLSGGVDSSLITALAQETSSTPIRSFTIGFDDARYDESQFASQVARILGTNHTEIKLREEDALEIIPTLPDVYDEPFGDSSQIPTCLVSREAAKHVKVVLGGDGGDELFAGYPRFFEALDKNRKYTMNKIQMRFKGARIRAAARFLGCLPHCSQKALTKRLSFDIPFLERKLRSIDELLGDCMPQDRYERYLMLWLEQMNPAGEVRMPFVPHTTSQSMWQSDPLAAMMFHDAANYMPGDILTKVDRAAMSVSLETRIPMLDHAVVKFALSQTSSIHAYDGKGKWLPRTLLKRYLPDDLVERKKKGFAVPVDEWLRGPLLKWADGLLEKDRLIASGLGNVDGITKEWSWHKSSRFSRGQALWGVLMFQSWFGESEESYRSPAIPHSEDLDRKGMV